MTGGILTGGLSGTSASFSSTLGVSGQATFINDASTKTLTIRDESEGYTTTFQAGEQSANITYTLPRTKGSANQLMTTDGNGVLTWADAASRYSTITSSADDKNMGISTSTFSSAVVSEAQENTAFGYGTLNTITVGSYNTAFGTYALNASTSASGNTAIGRSALPVTTTGGGNTAIGQNALLVNTEGYINTAIGVNSLENNTTGAYNIGIGSSALTNNTTGTYNIGIGYLATVSSGDLTNAIAIGYNSSVTASNTIQLGNSSITDVKTSGNIQTTSDKAFYFGDPTVDGTWRIVRSGDNLVYERRESGSWVTKLSMQP